MITYGSQPTSPTSKSAPGAIPHDKPLPKRNPSSATRCPFSTISNALWPPNNLLPLNNYIKVWKLRCKSWAGYSTAMASQP